jgi:general secretion pathway protein G
MATEDPEAGWTFMETLIVIGIVLILTSSVGVMAIRYLDKARSVSARSQIETYALALDAYYLDCGAYPANGQGLGALWEKPDLEPIPRLWNGPYVNKPVTADPWGNLYEYAVPGPNGLPFALRSFGADGTLGGEGKDGDVVSWEG